jgi:hypothetical protein
MLLLRPRTKARNLRFNDRRIRRREIFPVVGVRRSRRTPARELLQDVQDGSIDAHATRPSGRGNAHRHARRAASDMGEVEGLVIHGGVSERNGKSGNGD